MNDLVGHYSMGLPKFTFILFYFFSFFLGNNKNISNFIIS